MTPRWIRLLKATAKISAFDVSELDAKKLMLAADFIVENRKSIVENNLAVSETLAAKAFDDAKTAVSLL